jgi:SAM-dependent methyltransferase
MATVLLGVGIAVVLLFGFVVFFGPPYLPTRQRQTQTALDLLDLKPGQTLLELGSGDGRVARAAAARGLRVVAIELNPALVLLSRVVTWRYRRQVRVRWGSYFSLEWPPFDGIFTFMIGRQMAALDERIQAQRRGKPVRLASIAFRIPGKKAVAERRGVLLYTYK